MAEENSDSSTSESEISACSSNFDPMKALYSNKTKVPVENAPLYENLSQFQNAQQSGSNIIPVGHSQLVKKREEYKEKKKQEEQKALEEKNKQRFAKYQDMVPTTSRSRSRPNLISRIKNVVGPLRVLKDCVDQRLRVKVTTRNESGVRGVLHATLVAFDKQWNLAMTDVLEVWQRKKVKKRKVPPVMGTLVPKGTAATISPVPSVVEKPLGKGVVECTRHIPQLLVRGEHVVLINVVER